jgi:hypothetical protein
MLTLLLMLLAVLGGAVAERPAPYVPAWSVPASTLHPGEVAPADAPRPGRELLVGTRTVVVVPMGDAVREARLVATEFRRQADVEVQVAAPIRVPQAAIDAQRDQLDAELLTDPLFDGWDVGGGDLLVLGVVRQDLFSSAMPEWGWIFRARADKRAVLSTARLGWPDARGRAPTPAVRSKRLGSLVAGLLAMYVLRVEDDVPASDVVQPHNPLHAIAGLRDLDAMDRDMCGSVRYVDVKWPLNCPGTRPPGRKVFIGSLKSRCKDDRLPKVLRDEAGRVRATCVAASDDYLPWCDDGERHVVSIEDDGPPRRECEAAEDGD